ncbi:MAG: hypothetical protein R3F34_13865 [Planctomycetota bacterium]
MLVRPTAIVACFALPFAAGLGGCRATEVEVEEHADGPSAAESAGVLAAVDELYRAFCFEPGGEADWDAMRALFCDGAAFVAPLGRGQVPRAVDADAFVGDFQDWIRSSRVGRTGFHEIVTHVDVELFGTVAHTFVVFDGVVPESGVDAAGGPDAAARMRTRGVDSIEWARSGERWLLVSFTTQYASRDLPVPARLESEANAFAVPRSEE